jgi:hypothetical protein
LVRDGPDPSPLVVLGVDVVVRLGDIHRGDVAIAAIVR